MSIGLIINTYQSHFIAGYKLILNLWNFQSRSPQQMLHIQTLPHLIKFQTTERHINISTICFVATFVFTVPCLVLQTWIFSLLTFLHNTIRIIIFDTDSSMASNVRYHPIRNFKMWREVNLQIEEIIVFRRSKCWF
jgi:hypothetical protein